MTNEEAIQNLTQISRMYGHKWQQEACDIAIKTLEKQIPKKPLIRYEYMGFGVSPNETIIIYCCPCCKEDTDGATYYCQNCGQKIDWT